MKLGQVIQGYRIVERPTNANAGKCLWAFAEKDGREYFIKEFLDPKRPRPDSSGSISDRQHRLAECERFERRHREISGLLRANAVHAGHLVLPTDFFAEGTRYYKVTRWINGANTPPHQLPPPRRLFLLRTLADSLTLLHEDGIVHGDLKPENVLLYEHASGLHTTKLIDFDDAYRAGQAPDRESIGGDPRYGAPEWLLYVRGDPAVSAAMLTQAADMFAFGLLVHRYLFGVLPGHDTGYDCPAGAVLDGAPLYWHPELYRLRELLEALTHADPRVRPGVHETADILAGKHDRRPVPAARPGSRLRINLTGRQR